VKGRATGPRFEGARIHHHHHRRRRRVSRKSSCGLLALAATAAAAPLASRAATDNWQVGSGNWSTPGNWTTGLPADGDQISITESDAVNRVITYDYSGTNTFLSLTLDNTGTGINTLSQSAHALSIFSEQIGYEGNGVVNQSGGTHTIRGGGLSLAVLALNGFPLNGSGTYNLSGSGSLTVAGGEYVGYYGVGVFNQTGGTHTTDALYVGGYQTNSASANGTFKLSGGTLTVTGAEQIATYGTGVFNQLGGTHIFTRTLTLGVGGAFTNTAHATYNLSGGLVQCIQDVAKNGTLYPYPVYVGTGNDLGSMLNISGGTFDTQWGGILVFNPVSGVSGIHLTGGTLSTAALGMPDWNRLTFTGGTLNLTGGMQGSTNNPGNLIVGDSGGTAVLNEYFVNNSGFSGAQTFTSVAVGASLALGNSAGSTGTYNLSNSASLSVTNAEDVGYSGTGVFNQTGGTNSAGSLSLGLFPGSTGTYNLSNSASLTITGSEYVGNSGTGVFNQSGGVNNFSGAFLVLALQAGSKGTYNLSGSGVLNVTGSEVVASLGAGVFNQIGGTHTIGGLLDAAYSPGSTGTVNLSGGLLTASGVQLGGAGTVAGGAGILNVSGGGTLNAGTNAITVFNTSSGTNISGINISGGTVSAGNLFLPTTVNQSDGAFTLNQQLFLGSAGGTGIYNLSGGTLTVTGQENIGLGSGGSGTFTQTGGTNNALSLVDVGNGEPGTYNLQAGTLNVSAGAIDIAINGANGTYNQSGGVANALQVRVGAFGTGGIGIVNLSGGSLGVQSVLLGGFGTSAVAVGILNSTGGSLTASNGITIYNSDIGTNVSSMTINGGTVSTGFLTAPDWARLNFVSGTLNLTGGVSSNPGALIVGNGTTTTVATLNLTAGSVLADGASIGVNSGSGIINQTGGTFSMTAGSFETIGDSGTGTYNQSAGVHNAVYLHIGGGAPGAYNLSVSGVLNASGDERVGAGAPGVFTQTGGSNTINGNNFFNSYGLGIGSGGTYALLAGVLSVSNSEFLGLGDVGTFSQSNGAHTIGFNNGAAGGSLYLGGNTLGSGGTGNYLLSGGSLAVNSAEYVGYAGAGQFTQSSGTHTIGGLLSLGTLAGASGTVNLSGGSLTVLNIAIGGNGTVSGGTGLLNVTGGTLTGASIAILNNLSSFSLSGGTVSAAATLNNGKFNHTGGTASLGTLTGTGSVFVGNPGTAAAAAMTVTSFAQNEITVRNTGTLTVATNAARFTNSAPKLTLTGNGTLDLGNHELLTSIAPTTIKGYLAKAYDPAGNADWGQPGLTSSLARGNPTKFSVAYAFGGDPSAQDAGVTTHGGAPLGAQTLVRPVLTGDANMDGTVNFFDISQILGYKYNTGQAASYTDGDLDYNGKVDFFDISLLLSANYNTGQTFGPASAAAAPSLSGSHHTASTTSAVAASTTPGVPGDGKPDFEYNPLTGDLRFRTDGGTFTTTGGSASFVSSLTISSASGALIGSGASAAFAGGTGATLTSTLLSSALTNSPGFTDGFDIGLVLPPGLGVAELTADLTLKYQSLNGGSLKVADVVGVPEPAGLTLLAMGATALTVRRRCRRRSPASSL
jgi:hypothetical protein